MSIPLRPRKEPDPLDVIASQCHWGVTTNTCQLDIARYLRAIRDGEPIPTFQSIGKTGNASAQPRRVTPAMLAMILTSDHSVEDLEAELRVDALVISDLRRRHDGGGPPYKPRL